MQLFEKATPVVSSASEFVGQLPPLLLPELLPLPESLLLPPPLELPLLLPLPPPDELDPLLDPPLDPPELEVSVPLSAEPEPDEPPP